MKSELGILKVDEDQDFCPHWFDCHLKPDCLLHSGGVSEDAEQVVKGFSIKA